MFMCVDGVTRIWFNYEPWFTNPVTVWYPLALPAVNGRLPKIALGPGSIDVMGNTHLVTPGNAQQHSLTGPPTESLYVKITVWSSKRRFHCFWFINSPLKLLKQVSRKQHVPTSVFGGVVLHLLLKGIRWSRNCVEKKSKNTKIMNTPAVTRRGAIHGG